jgi:CDP-glycerol glycerophosphotransferase
MLLERRRGVLFLMVFADIKNNNQILDIILDRDTYNILLAVKHTDIQENNDPFFILQERYNEKHIYLSYSKIEEEKDYIFFQCTIPFNEHRQTFLESEIWDLYIAYKNDEYDDGFKKRRVKSNYDNIRFLTILFELEEKMFYPYTTKNGNLSFRKNHYFLYGEFEKVNLNNDVLSFSGYFNFPPFYKTNEVQINDLKLLVINDQKEIELPIKRVVREDIANKYHGNENIKNTGIKGEIKLTELMEEEVDNKLFFKYYLLLDYTYKNESRKLKSSRIRVKHLKNPFPQKKVFNFQNQKIKILVKPTKKSKYLSVQISRYNFKNEVIRSLRKKWIKIRRSKKLRRVYKAVFSLLSKLPRKKNTIMFESFHGKQFSDSPRAIYEYMLNNKMNFDMYWSMDRRHTHVFKDRDVKAVRRFSVKWLLLMARAEFWVSNSRLPLWIPKPKHTKYLQTWHGTPLKRLAADMDEVHMPGTNTTKYKENFIKESSKWDFLISPNAYSTEIFKRAFQFERKIIESGYPRNDFLINSNNQESINNIKKSNNLPLDKKIILYAPTWRDNQFYAKGKYKFNLRMDLDLMREKLGEKYILVLRLHYLVAENLDLTGYEDFVYDFSTYEDIRELYLIADLLITDYSSVFFDYANLKRPMLFYVYDIEEYRDNLRGFYFDFEKKAPGPLVKTTEEIIREVLEIERQGFKPSTNTEEFYRKFCYLEDGSASERVVNEVFLK